MSAHVCRDRSVCTVTGDGTESRNSKSATAKSISPSSAYVWARRRRIDTDSNADTSTHEVELRLLEATQEASCLRGEDVVSAGRRIGISGEQSQVVLVLDFPRRLGDGGCGQREGQGLREQVRTRTMHL